MGAPDGAAQLAATEAEVRAELERRRRVLVDLRRREFATGARPALDDLKAANQAVVASYAALALLRGLA